MENYQRTDSLKWRMNFATSSAESDNISVENPQNQSNKLETIYKLS